MWVEIQSDEGCSYAGELESYSVGVLTNEGGWLVRTQAVLIGVGHVEATEGPYSAEGAALARARGIRDELRSVSGARPIPETRRRVLR